MVNAEAQADCLSAKFGRLAGAVKFMVGVSHRYSQAEYSGMHNYLKQECLFVQCITPDVGKAFETAE